MAEKIFERDSFQGLDVTTLFKLDEKEKQQFHDWIKLFEDPKKLKRWRKFLPLCPIQERIMEAHGEERTITFEYRPITKNEAFSQMMVICSDVTDQRETEKALLQTEKENKLQMERILGVVNNNQASLNIFFDETEDLVNFFHRMMMIHCTLTWFNFVYLFIYLLLLILLLLL